MHKKPKQDRSIKTRLKLMSALDELLRLKDFEQITVAEIAQTAGVSTGLLYSHFKNKDDFLDALLEEYKARILNRLEEAEKSDLRAEFAQTGSLREAFRMITGLAYEQMLEDAHIILAVSQALRSKPNADWKEWQNIRARAFKTISPILSVFESEIARPINETTARTVVYFFNTIFLEFLMFRGGIRSSAPSLSQEEFIHHIADFAYGYLTTPA